MECNVIIVLLALVSSACSQNSTGPTIYVNEIFLQAYPLDSWIEIYNSRAAIDITDWVLRFFTNSQDHSYPFPNGTKISRSGYLTLYSSNLGFSFDDAYSVSLYDTSDQLVHSLDVVYNYGSFGLNFLSASVVPGPLQFPTPGDKNSPLLLSPVCIAEIFQKPIAGLPHFPQFPYLQITINARESLCSRYCLSTTPVNGKDWRLRFDRPVTYISGGPVRSTWYGCYDKYLLYDYVQPKELPLSATNSPEECGGRCAGFPFFYVFDKQCMCARTSISDPMPWPSSYDCSLACPGPSGWSCGGLGEQFTEYTTSYQTDIWSLDGHIYNRKELIYISGATRYQFPEDAFTGYPGKGPIDGDIYSKFYYDAEIPIENLKWLEVQHYSRFTGNWETMERVELNILEIHPGRSLKRRSCDYTPQDINNWYEAIPFVPNGVEPIKCGTKCPSPDPCGRVELWTYVPVFNYDFMDYEWICGCAYVPNPFGPALCGRPWPGYLYQDFSWITDMNGYWFSNSGKNNDFPSDFTDYFYIYVETKVSLLTFEIVSSNTDTIYLVVSPSYSDTYSLYITASKGATFDVPSPAEVYLSWDFSYEKPLVLKYNSTIDRTHSQCNCSQLCSGPINCWCYSGFISTEIVVSNTSSYIECLKNDINEEFVQLVNLKSTCFVDYDNNFQPSYQFSSDTWFIPAPPTLTSTFIGCHNGDASQFGYQFLTGNITVSSCLEYCFNVESSFSALLIQGGDTCYCAYSDSWKTPFRPISLCSMNCNGDNLNYCGGLTSYAAYSLPPYDFTNKGCYLPIGDHSLDHNAGALFWKKPLRLDKPMIVTFFFQIMNVDDYGFAFVMHNSPSGWITTPDQWESAGAYGFPFLTNYFYGMNQIATFIVEFSVRYQLITISVDTTNEGDIEDQYRYNAKELISVNCKDVRDSLPHYVQITYDPNTTQIDLYLDDSNTSVATTWYNLDELFYSQEVWFGFTSEFEYQAAQLTFVTVEVSCPDGYTAAEDRSDCIDINECTTNNGGCLQQCVNIPGSFYCKCFDGFYESNITCIDIDECATATHRCSYSCLDGLHPPGSYTCGCTSGFYANGTVCENINECALGTDLCSQICIDNEGSYSCDCHYGFRIDPRNRFGCIDIDECLQQNNCSQTCHNQIGTYNCSCFSGYTLAEDLNTCIDINECASATTNDCQYPVYCANSPGGFSCGCPIGYNSTDRVHCAPLPCLFEWNQWSSECFLCKGQIRNRNRTTDPDLNNGSPLCFGILYHEVQECQFPCVIKAQKDGASTTAALVQEWWSRGQWLADPTYFPDMTAHNVEQQGNNIMMMLSSPSSFLCSQDDPLVSNFTDTLIQNAQNITPGIDPSRFSVSLVPTNGQCGLQFSVSNIADYTLYYGIGGGAAALILIAILFIIFFLMWKRKLKLRQINYLPKPLRASFFYAFSGSRDGDYYQKEVFVGSPERKFIQSMLEEKLDLLPLQITNIHAVYSPQLLASFVNYWNNMESRIADNAKLWRSEAWKNIVDTNGLKKWVMSEYDKIIDTFSWNQGRLEPLIPAIHGTDLAIAQKICCNGFGALSTLDDGFYGKGIYFTTSCLYAVPYFATRAKPALILAYVLPGYPYPTTENRTGDHSLMGSAIMKGHQSHFVIVKRDGDPVPNIPSEDNSYYTELVVAQEAQVVPAYIIEIDRGNLPELMKKYQRAISDLIAENQSRQKKRNHSHEPDPDYHKSDDL